MQVDEVIPNFLEFNKILINGWIEVNEGVGGKEREMEGEEP